MGWRELPPPHIPHLDSLKLFPTKHVDRAGGGRLPMGRTAAPMSPSNHGHAEFELGRHPIPLLLLCPRVPDRRRYVAELDLCLSGAGD